MEKASIKTRDIIFFSKKNGGMVCVHTQAARDYAKWLEEQEWVEGYETNYPLELDKFSHVNPVDIRPDYFQLQWVSDFYIRYADGRIGIREVVKKDALLKRAVVEKLELSRRFWAALDVADWKVILC